MNGMKVDSAIQAARFLYTLLFGMAARILYVLLQNGQNMLRGSKLRSYLLDAAFWILILAGFTAVIQLLCGGELRIYTAVGAAVGFAFAAILEKLSQRNTGEKS